MESSSLFPWPGKRPSGINRFNAKAQRRSAASRNQNRAEGMSRAEAQRRRERPTRNAMHCFLCASAPLREKIFAGMRDSDGLQCKEGKTLCVFATWRLGVKNSAIIRGKIFAKLREAAGVQCKELKEKRLRCFFFAIFAFSCGQFIFGCGCDALGSGRGSGCNAVAIRWRQ